MDKIDPNKFGVSFSLKQCRNFGLQQGKVLAWLLNQAGFRRFRLMSYWNEHEKSQGQYDFDALDEQVRMIEQAGGIITMCLGARQPRWPENHWPNWAWQLPKADRTQALLRYIEVVVRRYQDRPVIISWQLENEALLSGFGTRSEIDRPRLRQEFDLIKALDPTRPIIMSTSTHWGIPARQPIPDIVGFSYYLRLPSKRGYRSSGHAANLHRTRAALIKSLLNRPSFIHELQLEPWVRGKAIWEASLAEQNEAMGPEQIKHNLAQAKRPGLYPIDLWGGEWWYWRINKFSDRTIWHAVKHSIPNAIIVDSPN